jgi:HK97 family phage portal protein
MKNVSVATGLNPIDNPQTKSSQTGPLLYMQTAGRPVWSPRNYASFAKEGYQQNAVVYRSVRLLADTCAAIPLVVYDADDEPVDDHPFLDLLEAPNPFEGKEDLLDAIYSYQWIAGNTYIEGVMLGQVLKELYVLRPDRISISVDNKGRPASYTYKVGQSEIIFKVPTSGQREILQIKQFNPLNDLYGQSPIEAAAFSIDINNESGAFNKSLLQNSARPSGALVVMPDKQGDAALTEEQFSRLKGELQEKYSGAANAGRPMLLEGGLDWKQMGLGMEDLQFIEGKNQSAREIALALGVPPMLLGIPGDNTYSNYKEAQVAFIRQTCLPLVCKVTQALTVWLKPTYGKDFYVGFDINQIPGLSSERDETWTRINQSGVLTVNEKREAIGYDEVEGGDELLVPSSLIPLDMAIEPPAPEDDPSNEDGGDDEDSNEDDSSDKGSK